METIEYAHLNKINPDIIIDARSPAEFSHSHIVNAQNFYALSDAEHKEIGTIYKQLSKHHAKVLGASYICKNASKHLLELEKILKAGSKICIYCARGGLRSSSLGSILEQVGFRVWKIQNGYKAYRNYVINLIEEKPKIDFITLFGNTGCGKTRLIKALHPSIDLEALANHQGSTFGLIHGSQPSMKTFQNKLAHTLEGIQKHSLCFIEGESRKIGTITLPKALHEKMRQGISVEIVSSMEYRVGRIVEEYKHISDDFFFSCMQRLKPYMAKLVRDEIIKKYQEKNLKDVAFLLLKNYYDRVYKKPSKIDHRVRFDDDLQKSLKELEDIRECI
ncbi:MAG: tRNA 2-selenouridine(34) synthase MnmH [Proteobacteria bacterium]|nr:MAG: tRNA 2-selenouridine(34) synthase MnmH [Pseudomonadota bacterium]